jgi:hypothetical protein
VKSTPTRGVKQFLKPDTYKQWERARQRRAPQTTDNRGQMTERLREARARLLFSVVCPLFSEGSPSVSP